MSAVSTSQTSVNCCQATGCNFPEDIPLHTSEATKVSQFVDSVTEVLLGQMLYQYGSLGDEPGLVALNA